MEAEEELVWELRVTGTSFFLWEQDLYLLDRQQIYWFRKGKEIEIKAKMTVEGVLSFG